MTMVWFEMQTVLLFYIDGLSAHFTHELNHTFPGQSLLYDGFRGCKKVGIVQHWFEERDQTRFTFYCII